MASAWKIRSSSMGPRQRSESRAHGRRTRTAIWWAVGLIVGKIHVRSLSSQARKRQNSDTRATVPIHRGHRSEPHLLVTDRAVTLSRNTTKHIASLVFAFFISSAVAAPPAQDQDQKTSVDASSSDQAASSSAPAPSTLEPETEVRAVSLKLLVPNILRDQKPIWSFPLKLALGKRWKP